MNWNPVQSDVIVVHLRPGIGTVPDEFVLGCGHTWTPPLRSPEWKAAIAAFDSHRAHEQSRGLKVQVEPPLTVTCPTCQGVIDAAKAEVRRDAALQLDLVTPGPQPSRCNHVKPGTEPPPPFYCSSLQCTWRGAEPRPKASKKTHGHGTCPWCGCAVLKNRRAVQKPVTCELAAHTYDKNNAFTYHRNGKHVW